MIKIYPQCKVNTSFIFLFFFVLISAGNASAGSINKSDRCDEAGFENQYYLIGVENVEQVSQFFSNLSANYFASKDIFAEVIGEQVTEEKYYDDFNLNALRANYEIYKSKRELLNDYRSDKEKITIENHLINLYREFEVKNYSKQTSRYDKHPFLRFIKRDQRAVLEELFVAGKVNLDLNSMNEKLIVKHQEFIFLLQHFGRSYGQISIDNVHVENFGLPNITTIFSIKIDGKALASLKDEEKSFILSNFCKITSDFKRQLPAIKARKHLGYKFFHNIAVNQLPARDFFQQHIIYFKLSQILILSIIGFLFLYLMLGRYSKEKVTRVTQIRMTKKYSDKGEFR